jgi:transcription elongation GreA/GreB family factor
MRRPRPRAGSAPIGEDEADPARGSISYVAPLARALLGKAVGDVAVVNGAEVEVVGVR